jgi:hypothetical protein
MYPDDRVETRPGRLFELSVLVDGRPVYSAGKLAYPLPGVVVERVRAKIESWEVSGA